MKKFFVLFLTAMILKSCSFEYRATKSFEENIPRLNIMLLMPDYLIKTNAKYDVNFDSLDAVQYDSLIQISRFLNIFEDSSFLNEYKTALKNEFDEVGVNVYFENQWPDFLLKYNESKNDLIDFVILDFKQIELEEKLLEEFFSEYIGDLYYNESLIVNALSLNSWVSISILDSNFRKENLVFFSSTLKDQVDAAFKPKLFSLEADFLYKLDSLNPQDVDNIYNLAAKELTYNSFNYLVNTYMDLIVLREKGRLPDYYSQFNKKVTKIYPVTEKPEYYIIKKED